VKSKQQLLVLIGTRPEAIKLAPVVLALARSRFLAPHVCLTGQHATMAAEMLAHFGLKQDSILVARRGGQGLTGLVGTVASELAHALARLQPAGIIVQGDTTSAMLGAIAGFYERIPVFHIEAGLRSFDMEQPFPEEFNRRVISLAASLHFCPTGVSRANLLAEGVPGKSLMVAGNTCIDALMLTLSKSREKRRIFSAGKRGILVTGHRRENWDLGLESMCRALAKIAAGHDDVEIVYAVHPNPLVKRVASEILSKTPNVRLVDPLGYADFCGAMRDATLIISDSGGVQEEALALGTPVLVTRNVTERPEVLKWKTVRLVGTEEATICREANRLLNDPRHLREASRPHFPFGKGDASLRIAKRIEGFYQPAGRTSRK